MRKGLPRLQRLMRPVERLVRPRLTPVTGHGGTRLIGAVTLLLSLIAWLPVIGLHYLPALLIAQSPVELPFDLGALRCLRYKLDRESLVDLRNNLTRALRIFLAAARKGGDAESEEGAA